MPDALNFDPYAPYLSIVCAFGHAQRANKWLNQTRAFLAATVRQAALQGLPTEIILVDWNARGERPAASLLAPLPQNSFAAVRIVSVPESEIAAHGKLDQERRAQNIGIRRARGHLILAAGTDIVPSGDLMAHLATRPLRGRCIYYALRFDTVPDYLTGPIPAAGDIETACRRAASGGGLPPHPIPFDAAVASASDVAWHVQVQGIAAEARLETLKKSFEFSLTNFLLLDRESWSALGGFPEWNVGDSHLDRIVMGQARFRGWDQEVLPAPCHYFSVSKLREPDVTQDFYTDAHGDLRIRIESPPIRNLNHGMTATVLTGLNLTFTRPPLRLPTILRINDSDWGLAGRDLPEQAHALAHHEFS